jgi:hypothetical protein
VKDAFICATLVGTKRVLPAAEGDQLPRVDVLRAGAEPVVPRVGDLVTARVVRINPRLAAVDILCVGPRPVRQRYSGVIRTQDVRATEIDKVRGFEPAARCPTRAGLTAVHSLHSARMHAVPAGSGSNDCSHPHLLPSATGQNRAELPPRRHRARRGAVPG